MGILDQLLNKVTDVNEGLTSGALIRNVVVEHENDIMERQLAQLFEGKTATGDDIRPYYSEDLQPGGYFKNKESALRYAEWKRSLSYPVQAARNVDAPNLFINGKFHSELGVKFDAETMEIDGRTGYAQMIVAKYGLAQFGLSPERWADIFENCGGLEELTQEIKNILWQ